MAFLKQSIIWTPGHVLLQVRWSADRGNNALFKCSTKMRESIEPSIMERMIFLSFFLLEYPKADSVAVRQRIHLFIWQFSEIGILFYLLGCGM